MSSEPAHRMAAVPPHGFGVMSYPSSNRLARQAGWGRTARLTNQKQADCSPVVRATKQGTKCSQASDRREVGRAQHGHNRESGGNEKKCAGRRLLATGRFVDQLMRASVARPAGKALLQVVPLTFIPASRPDPC